MGRFWQTKTLEQMSSHEWEQLCDGCAKCCLVKLEDSETGEIEHTNVTCQLLDIETCRCSMYKDRHSVVSDCISLDRDNIRSLNWLPETCSYRLISEGKTLPSWHHLVSGDMNTLHEYGASLRGWVISERDVRDEDIQDHIIQWVD